MTALFEDGPVAGTRMRVAPVEGRPPKTIDVEDDGNTYRYCLDAWTQQGWNASYTFLYQL